MDTVPDVIASVKPLPPRDDEPRFRHPHDVAALEHYRANTFRLARRSITKVRCFQGGRPALRARFDDPYLQLTSGGWEMAFARDGVLTGDARPCLADGLRIARLLHEDLDGLPVEFVQSDEIELTYAVLSRPGPTADIMKVALTIAGSPAAPVSKPTSRPLPPLECMGRA
jgi:hypothetical protein